MDATDQRDYAEEAANRALMHEEAEDCIVIEPDAAAWKEHDSRRHGQKELG